MLLFHALSNPIIIITKNSCALKKYILNKKKDFES